MYTYYTLYVHYTYIYYICICTIHIYTIQCSIPGVSSPAVPARGRFLSLSCPSFHAGIQDSFSSQSRWGQQKQCGEGSALRWVTAALFKTRLSWWNVVLCNLNHLPECDDWLLWMPTVSWSWSSITPGSWPPAVSLCFAAHAVAQHTVKKHGCYVELLCC